jgi:hypothetical protein
MPVKYGPPAGDENSPPPDQGRAYQKGRARYALRATHYALRASPRPHRQAQGTTPRTSHKPRQHRGIVFTQSVVTAVTRERTKQRLRARALTPGRPYRHKPRQGQKQDQGQRQRQGQRPEPSPIGGGFPHPRNPIIEAARVLSNTRRFDSPGRQRQNQHPASRRPGHSPSHTSQLQARAGKTTPTSRPPPMARKTPAARPPQPGRQRPPAPEPGPATRNPRRSRETQTAESGQSQEPPPGKPDISAYVVTKPAHDSDSLDFRIIVITSLYRHCHGTAKGSPNHLTNVARSQVRRLPRS